MKRHLKLIAVMTAVVLALSGFSLARGGKGGGRGGSGGGGGGGCGKDSSSSSSYRYNSTTGGSSSSGSGSSGSSGDREPDAEIVDCVAEDKKTVVKLVSRGRTDTYRVYVDFLDGAGQVVDTGSERVRLKAGETKRVEVEADPVLVSQVRDCRLDYVL
ncbi:hypothetical protein [Streptomyces macrosporus]